MVSGITAGRQPARRNRSLQQSGGGPLPVAPRLTPGSPRWVGAESFERLNGWLTTPVLVNPRNLGWMAGGLLFTFFLKGMRSAFVWWRSTVMIEFVD